jgi:HEAT repeat protein
MRKTVMSLLLLSAISTSTLAQNQDPVTIVKGKSLSLTEQLKQHHVDMTEAGLVHALRSTDEQVRYLAALRLAEEGDTRSIPAVTTALESENVESTRVNLAIALAQMGQERGDKELTSACERSDLPGFLRARAAGYLLDEGKEVCLSAALEMLSADADSRIQALSLLPRYRALSNVQSREILESVVRCLVDETPAVRIAASAALSEVAKQSAIPYLENAMASEHDDAVRLQIRAKLESLRQKHH